MFPIVVRRYESQKPSKLQGRRCAAYTVCPGETFEKSAGNGTGDRACTPMTQCNGVDVAGVANGTQWQSVAPRVAPAGAKYAVPTALSDRLCSNLTVCGSRTYESKAPARTGDRECSALTPPTLVLRGIYTDGE